MQKWNAGRVLVACTALTLAACADEPSSPLDGGRGKGSASIGDGCGNIMAQRTLSGAGQSITSLSVSRPPTLAPVTVTATFSGLPWNIMQQMQFPLNVGAQQALCLNSPVATYRAETLYVAPLEAIPTPPGVDPDFWTSLSPREQRALIAKAKLLMELYPNKYPTVGSAIDAFFKSKMLPSKSEAKLRSIDFLGGTGEAELMAGGVYGCLLYQRFSRDPNWFLSNRETLELVSELVTAWAEAQLVTSPLRALQFGRNGVFGAAMAQASPEYATECGRLIFDSIPGGRIDVRDPYALPSSGATPPAGNPMSPPAPPFTGGPDGWWDQ